MRRTAALSGVSRSWYLLVSIVFVCVVGLLPSHSERSSLSHYPRGGARGNTLLLGSPCGLGILGANGTPSSAILRGCGRRAERDSRGGTASRVAADAEPSNSRF